MRVFGVGSRLRRASMTEPARDRPVGELDRHAVRALSPQLDEAVRADYPQVILDLSAVTLAGSRWPATSPAPAAGHGGVERAEWSRLPRRSRSWLGVVREVPAPRRPPGPEKHRTGVDRARPTADGVSPNPMQILGHVGDIFDSRRRSRAHEKPGCCRARSEPAARWSTPSWSPTLPACSVHESGPVGNTLVEHTAERTRSSGPQISSLQAFSSGASRDRTGDLLLAKRREASTERAYRRC
jgi:hypothetical protein